MLMGGKGGGKNALAAKPNLLSALRVQTSSYGQVIPIVYGQNRIASRLIWAGDFVAIPHTSTTKVGGKGLGSGGGNAITNTTYTYQTAVAMALCSGPILNIHNVWDTKGRLTLISATVPFTVPGGGGGITVTPPGTGIFHSHRGVGRADAFSFSQNDFGSDGSVSFSGTQQTPMVQVVSSPGVGQFTQVGAVFTFSAADVGKVMTISYVYSVPDSNSNGQPQQKLSLTLFTGSRPQTPWSYLTSAHPGQDLGYQGLAYVAASAMDLGESGTLPNLSFEVLGILPFGAGVADAEPSAIIADLLSNPFYAMGGVITPGNLTQYKNFCTANGLFISPMLDSQKAASAWIQEILDITNAAAVWSEGVLKIIPYGDTTAVGNGVSFIPNTSPIYDLTTSDLLTQVVVKRPSVAEVMNAISVEWCNRANDYNPDVAEDKDDAMIALYGLRKASPVTAHSITTTTVAKFAANLIRKRSVEIRATYTFSLGWQFNLLEPMDLVTLTIPEIGYNKKPVRITAMREDDKGMIEVDCEDFPWGTAAPTLYPHQVGAGFITQANSDPGSVSTPIIFEANDRLSLTGNYEVWLGVCGPNVAITGASNTLPITITATNHGFKSGQKVNIVGVAGNTAANGTWVVTVVDPNNFTLNGSGGSGVYTSGGIAVNLDWGGCSVWLSPDNSTYVQIGKMYGPSRMGNYTAPLGILGLTTASISTVSRTSNVVTVTLTAPANTFTLGAIVAVFGITDPSFNGQFLIASVISSTKFTYNQTGVNATSSGGSVQECLAVNLTTSNGTLNSGSSSDADNFRTMCIIDAGALPELISYQLAGLTAANQYILVYLQRGIFGSGANVHTAPGTFLRLDDGVFIWEADPTLVGTTIFFKFTSFNTMGLMEQSLANATAYSFAFNGIFGNHDETPANNATIDSVFVSGTADNIRIYGASVGASYTAWKMKDQGATRTIPAQTLSLVDDTGVAPQISTIYWISYDFNAATHRAWANYDKYVQAIYRGQMRVGSLTTCNAAGTGGTTGGQGTSSTGTGSGAPGRPLPQL